jgi:hypothetical protein
MRFTQKVTDDAVKDCLTVVPPNEYIVTLVNCTSRIDDFVASVTGNPYVKGSTFYMLTKQEIIQKHKQIFIQNKKTKDVFQGVYARSLLGISEETTRVTPLHTVDYDIFIQSTSLNRKLVSGTKVLIITG